MKIGFANDHAAVEMKNIIMAYVKEKYGVEVVNYGTDTNESCNYAEFGEKLGNAVASKEVDLGIAICGSGVGISISCNKVNGVRAVCCSETYSARLSRMHNNSNILCFGARVVAPDVAKDIVDSWLNATFEGGRHQKRIDYIAEIEKKN